MRCHFPYFDVDLRLPSPAARHQLTVRDGYGLEILHHVVYLQVTPQLSLVLISAAHGEMARLSLPGWLVLRLGGVRIK